MSIELEKYNRGRGRHTCPKCGKAKQFSRYVVSDTGAPVADHVGICNRASKCGYNYTPKNFYADNPQSKPSAAGEKTNAVNLPKKFTPPLRLDFHNVANLKESLQQAGENPFMRYLFNLFPDDKPEVEKTAQKYFVGFFNKLTCFWQIDYRGRIRKGKLLRYDPVSGKRQTIYRWTERNQRTGEDETVEIKTYWVHKVLQKRQKLSEDINFTNCFFGEHLLKTEKNKTVCIVESEKTAILAALCYPQYLWLSVGAQSHLTEERMRVLKGRNVIFYPDGDAFELWSKKSQDALRIGVNARVSSLIENSATKTEKENGFDLADYIHREQTRINNLNQEIDLFNAKVERIEADQYLSGRYREICAEQEAILEIEQGNLSMTSRREIIQMLLLTGDEKLKKHYVFK